MFRNSHKSLFVVLAILVTLSFACIDKANAQTHATPCSATTQNNELCITGAAITTDTNGNAITGVTYRIEQKFGTGSYANVATGLAALQYHAKSLAPGTYTFRAYANCAACSAETGASNAATGSATAIPVIPNTPVIIIAATIRANGPPTYRIIQSITLKPNEVVLVAPSSMRPLFASR